MPCILPQWLTGLLWLVDDSCHHTTKGLEVVSGSRSPSVKVAPPIGIGVTQNDPFAGVAIEGETWSESE